MMPIKTEELKLKLSKNKRLKLYLFTSLLCFVYTCQAQLKKPDSLKLFFESAKYQLTEKHKTTIKNFIKNINIDEVQQIRIKGYTDFVGNHVYNNKLSKQRANTVYKYITQNFQFNAIAQQGLGELDHGNSTQIEEGVSKHRKVDIILSYEKPKPIFLSLTRKQKYLSILPKLTIGEKLRLRNINFQISTTILTKISDEDLEGITKILKVYPKLHILIEGHVCCGTKEEYETKIASKENLSLSTQRAKKIHDEFVKRGIDPKRLSYKGYGFTRPLDFPENTLDIQKENRRIELKILKK